MGNGGFQFISYFFDGSGSVGRTATLVGWGFLPLLIGMGLQFVATAVAFGNAPSPAAINSNRQALTAVQQLQSDPFVQVAQIARNMTLLWSGYIWVFAVEHARGLSRKNATITLGIVLAITVGYGVVTNLVV